ncbi:MAG: hypothetical protein ACQERK_05640 [Campylobacterota bacterium]
MFIALIIIIGLVIFIFEQKNKKSYRQVFDDFIVQMQNSNQPKEEKIARIKAMLSNNGYSVKEDASSITGEKKIFSLGLLLATLGLYYLYFLLLQRPHRIIIDKAGL